MKLLLLSALLLSFFSVNGQIESGKVSKEDATKIGVERSFPLATTQLYLGAGQNFSYRDLMPNKTPFGAPLGTRANEQTLALWTFQFGYKQLLSKHAQLDVALHMDKFGETYSYESLISDSAFSYTNKYAFLGIPIQCNFTFGQRLVFQIGGGIQPMLATKQETEEQNTDADKNVTTNSFSSLSTLNGFGCNLLLNTGVQFRCNKNIGVFLTTTYSHGLVNTYERQATLKHYTRGVNVKSGIVIYLAD